jgi:hypothetical protein
VHNHFIKEKANSFSTKLSGCGGSSVGNDAEHNCWLGWLEAGTKFKKFV